MSWIAPPVYLGGNFQQYNLSCTKFSCNGLYFRAFHFSSLGIIYSIYYTHLAAKYFKEALLLTHGFNIFFLIIDDRMEMTMSEKPVAKIFYFGEVLGKSDIEFWWDFAKQLKNFNRSEKTSHYCEQ